MHRIRVIFSIDRGMNGMDSMHRRHIQHWLCLMTLVIMAFMLCPASVSILYDPSSHPSAFSDPTGSFAGRDRSLQPTENQFFLSALPAQPALHEIRPAQRTAGSVQKRQSSLQSIPGGQILSVSGILLFVHYFTVIAGKRNKHRSVIALLIGGHGPPLSQAG